MMNRSSLVRIAIRRKSVSTPSQLQTSNSKLQTVKILFFDRYLPPKFKLPFMKDFSYITQSHPAYIENLYKDFVQNPESVDPEYRKFFEGFDFALSTAVNEHATEQLNGSAA